MTKRDYTGNVIKPFKMSNSQRNDFLYYENLLGHAKEKIVLEHAKMNGDALEIVHSYRELLKFLKDNVNNTLRDTIIIWNDNPDRQHSRFIFRLIGSREISRAIHKGWDGLPPKKREWSKACLDYKHRKCGLKKCKCYCHK